jgi:hypothetical protein
MPLIHWALKLVPAAGHSAAQKAGRQAWLHAGSATGKHGPSCRRPGHGLSQPASRPPAWLVSARVAGSSTPGTNSSQCSRARSSACRPGRHGKMGLSASSKCSPPTGFNGHASVHPRCSLQCPTEHPLGCTAADDQLADLAAGCNTAAPRTA